MKKVKRLVILVLFFVLGITMVNAKSDIFNYAWNKDIIENEMFDYVLMTTKTKFQNGYFISSMNEMNYYNYKGELIVHKDITDSAVLAAKEVDNYLYVLMLSGDSSSEESTTNFSLVKLDKDLNVVKEILIGTESAGIYSLIFTAVKYAGYNLISTINDEITIVGSEDGDLALLHYDKELNYKGTDALKSNDYIAAEEYYPFISEIMKFIKSMENMENPEEMPESLMVLSDQKGSKKVYNGADLSQCEVMYLNMGVDERREAPPCYISSLIKLTNDNQVIFEKNYEDYTAIINAKVMGNYIVALGIKNLGNTRELNVQSELELLSQLESDIIVLNMQGEIVQTINKTNYKYVSIEESDAGFITNIFNMACSNPDNCTITMGAEAFDFPREVMTKITGKGNISVANTSIAGDNVTYVITPEKGYVLGKVIITDENGNVIETTNNTFTMPSAAVTIEVEFLPENPETRDIAVIAFGIVLLLGTILTLVNYKRLKTIR